MAKYFINDGALFDEAFYYRLAYTDRNTYYNRVDDNFYHKKCTGNKIKMDIPIIIDDVEDEVELELCCTYCAEINYKLNNKEYTFLVNNSNSNKSIQISLGKLTSNKDALIFYIKSLKL